MADTRRPGTRRTPTADRLLTTGDVADYLQVTVQTVGKMIRIGELPAKKIAREWRVRPADLAAFVDAAPGNELPRELNGYR